MGQEEFDQFVAALWETHGWETINVPGRAAALAGTAGENGLHYAIHTAEYRMTEVDGKIVDRYAADYESSERVTPVIVTTGKFSWEARERASIWNVKLVDGDDLINRIESAGAYDILNTYSPILLASNTAAEIETQLDQQEQTFEANEEQRLEIETRPPRPWLTVLPGITLDRNWILRFIVLLVAVVTLIPMYNALPAGGPVVLRLARIVVYFAVLGSLAGVLVSFYMDMKLIQQADTYWNPIPVVYLILVSFTFGLVWLLYFHKRQYHLGGFLRTPPLDTGSMEV
jgi:hypothetical protein